MYQFAERVVFCKPTIYDVIGFMDGTPFTLAFTDECITLNSFFCRHNCDRMVNNLLANCPDWKVSLSAMYLQEVG